MLPGIENGVVNLAYIVAMLVVCLSTIPAILYFGTVKDDGEKK